MPPAGRPRAWTRWLRGSARWAAGSTCPRMRCPANERAFARASGAPGRAALPPAHPAQPRPAWRAVGAMIRVEIVGHGVAGLCAAHAFAERGCAVTVVSRSRGLDATCTSWWAGGMLAPDCEMEAAEPLIGRLGAESV